MFYFYKLISINNFKKKLKLKFDGIYHVPDLMHKINFDIFF